MIFLKINRVSVRNLVYAFKIEMLYAKIICDWILHSIVTVSGLSNLDINSLILRLHPC